jgi:hypothetical protein
MKNLKLDRSLLEQLDPQDQVVLITFDQKEKIFSSPFFHELNYLSQGQLTFLNESTIDQLLIDASSPERKFFLWLKQTQIHTSSKELLPDQLIQILLGHGLNQIDAILNWGLVSQENLLSLIK